MASRTRLWVCRCCRLAWTRRRADASGPYHCGGPTSRAFRFPPARKRPCPHVATDDRIREFKDRYWEDARRQSLRLFRPTTDLRALWKGVRAARTKACLVRRAQRFVDALRVYCFDTFDEAAGKFVRRGRTLTSNMIITNAWMEAAAPRVELRVTHGEHGSFNRSVLAGVYAIYLNPVVLHSEYADPLDSMRSTLVHECLHYVDSIAGVSGGGHDRRWSKRLRKFVAMFPAAGVRQ